MRRVYCAVGRGYAPAVRRLGVFAIVPAALAAAAVALAASSPAAKVAAVLLKPAQVGTGFKLRELAGGRQVRNQVTLDLCGYRFTSEALRLARHQVAYVKQGTTQEALSNEVVAYKPGGAARAMRELHDAIAHCPRGYVPTKVQGVGPMKNRLAPLAQHGLLPGTVAEVDHVTELRPNNTVASYVAIFVYQVRDDVLSGVYTFGAGSGPLALRAAAAAARNLRSL
jgi:hypothetical protein